MHRRVPLGLAVLAGLLASAGPAAADPGHDEGTGRPGDAVISDYLPPDSGLPGTGPDLMTDTLAEAYLKSPQEPGGGGPVTCTRIARNSPSSAPPNATEQQIVYFRPRNVQIQEWDRGTICSNCYKNESNIGFANHNTRRWMTTQSKVAGKAYRFRIRTASAYGCTAAFVDVMHLQGLQDESYYATDTWRRLNDEFRSRGWDQPNVKYVVYADVLAHIPAGSSSSPGGEALFNSNKAFAYRRLQVRDMTGATSVRKMRWGCHDEGDVPAIHEATHIMGAVAAGSPDYYNTTQTGRVHHVWQTNDLMSYAPASSLSGKSSGGGTYPIGPLVWDTGADSYTSRVLGFPSYLTNGPGTGPHSC